MLKFLVKINAYQYHAQFEVMANDNVESIENAIIDKLGKKDIKWDYLGEMMNPKINRITYEEVINGEHDATSKHLYVKKRGLDLEWEQEHLKEGRYTLNMVKIDRKVRDVISHIKIAEAQKEHLQNKIEGSEPQVSVAT